MRNLINLSNIDFSFEDKIILQNLNLEVIENSIHTIIGRTGTGKSVILKLLSRIHLPDSGKINIDGKKKVSFVFQDSAFFNWFSVRKNLQLTGSNDQFLELSERFGLNAYLDHYPNQLSGGTKQKFNLLRAFVNKPDLILLDEPFTHMDPVQKEELYTFTINLWKENRPTIVLVTHDIDEALFLSHKISFLSQKQKSLISHFNIKKISEVHCADILAVKELAQYSEMFKTIYSLYKQDGDT